MLKKITIALMFCLPMTIMAQSLKFGYFNSVDVLPLMAEYKKAQTDMDAWQKQMSDEFQTMQTEYQRKAEELQKLQADTANPLPQNIADRRMQDLRDIEQRAVTFQQEAQQTMQNKYQELMLPVQQKLDEAIKAVGAEGGYSFIFDLNTTPIPYVNDTASTDVTAQVKAKLGIL
jgi:outer membrane protein